MAAATFNWSPNMARYLRKCCPATYTARFLVAVGIIAAIHYWYSEGGFLGIASRIEEEFVTPHIEFPSRNQYANILKERADEDQVVMLAMIDVQYASTALNFYTASVKKYNLRNIVFIAIDKHSCDIMAAAYRELKSACFAFKDIGSADETISPNTVANTDSTYLKRFFVLEALKLGYTVLQLDLDVIFLHNPMPITKKLCGKCDLAILWDSHLEHYDPAFVYVTPSHKTVVLYNRLAAYELSHGVGKLAMNAALKEAKKGKLHAIKVEPLTEKEFQVGRSFFERNTCPLHEAFKGVIVVHNNYIQDRHNKNFRLKECMLWDWDGFGAYFTNTSRKYLTVEAPGEQGDQEHYTLLNAFAIGRLLRRTVILPRLKCKQTTQCNLLMRMYDHTHISYIKRFNAANGHNYRESTFLLNPRVPSSIKNSVSPIFHISYKDENFHPASHGEPIKHLNPVNKDHGPSVSEIKEWLGARPESVLRFDTLQNVFPKFDYNDILGHHLVNVIEEL